MLSTMVLQKQNKSVGIIVLLLLGALFFTTFIIATSTPPLYHQLHKFGRAKKSEHGPVNKMYKVKIQNARARDAVANDGSDGIFYFKPSLTGRSNNILIALEGGWSCSSPKSCETRWKGDPSLMTTKDHGETSEGLTYNSQDSLRSPFWDWNQIFCPYVSSDFWTGRQNATPSMRWEFHGKDIITAIYEDVFKNGFVNPRDGKIFKAAPGAEVVNTGESAGGIGALLNSNYLGDLVTKKLCPTCKFASIPDSGFFIGIKDDVRSTKKCGLEQADPQKCSYRTEVISDAHAWNYNATVDTYCAAAMRAAKRPLYHCMFGEVIANHLIQRYRVFLVQYLFDAAELLADGLINITTITNATDLAFLAKLTLIRRTILNEFPSYSPSCLGHVLSLPTTLVPENDILDRATEAEAISQFYFHNSNKSWHDKCVTPNCRKHCYGKQ